MSNADEPAFPLPHVQTDNGLHPGVPGLTKREYFAAQALQGLLACPHQMCGDIENQIGLSVEFADALIAELSKEQQK